MPKVIVTAQVEDSAKWGKGLSDPWRPVPAKESVPIAAVEVAAPLGYASQP